MVTIRDIETDEDFGRIEGLAEMAGAAWMNRLLLPENLQSDRELRTAAATLHADMVLIYTIETVFTKEDSVTPLSVVTLGLSPTVKVYVTTTASALLMDTRTGYVYGVAEGVGRHEQPAAWWTSEDAVDQSRRKTERAAFEDLLEEFETLWPKVVENLKKKLEVGS